ncbi:unnamed protein product [Symbiodinium sp. CCMP2592]|nr:unnamed protein product [Symbiodinium sp. CCMP2592]
MAPESVSEDTGANSYQALVDGDCLWVSMIWAHEGNFTALVLSGGGAKGAYELGVLEGICRNDSLHKYRNWSMIVGTSIGALNAGALAQYQPEEQCTKAIQAAQAFWDTIKAPEDVWVSSELADVDPGDTKTSREPCLTGIRAMSMAMAFYRRGGVCDPKPGRKAFEFAVKKERIRQSGMMLRVVATSLATGLPKWWQETDERIIEGCEASGAIAPLIFPKEVDGVGYIDGGFVANTPIMKALEEGAQTVIVVELNPMSSNTLIPSLQKLYAADEDVGLRILEFEASLMQQRYFLEHELQMACQRFPDRKIMAFLPRSDVGDFMTFTEEALQKMRRKGLFTVANQELENLCEVFAENSLFVVEDFSSSGSNAQSGDEPEGASNSHLWALAAVLGFTRSAWFLIFGTVSSMFIICRSWQSCRRKFAETQISEDPWEPYYALDV